MDIKREGDLLYILGKTGKELGGSEYLASLGMKGSSVPQVDAARALARYRKLHQAITSGLIRAAHDISDGGLVVCLAEMAFAGGLGMDVDLRSVPSVGLLTDTEILYSETQSRIVIEVKPEHAAKVEELLGSDAACIGKSVKTERLLIRALDKNILMDEDITALKGAWKATLDF
jgi:phosphoribosylformylglycinamidine synthase